MSYLAFLDLSLNTRSRTPTFDQLSSDRGYPVRTCDDPSHKSIDRFLSEAQGLLLWTSTFLYDQALTEHIHTAISNGKRAWVFAGPNELDRLNIFLERYGMEATSIGASVPEHARKDLHPRIVPIDRDTDSASYVIPKMFDGVEHLALQQPQALRLDERAMPLLTLPLEKVQLTELKSDYFTNWPISSVPVLALSDTSFRSHGGILATTSSFWHDRYTGITGANFPGITYGDNERFTINIVEWLIQERFPRESLDVKAYGLINRIERVITDLVRLTLAQGFGPEWWDLECVDNGIRAKAEKRRDREGNYLPARAYLEISDLCKIIEDNWPLFRPAFARFGFEEDSSTALSWNMQLREIRNRTMHPTKQHMSGAIVSTADVQWLRELHERLNAV
jgi:hypothetical protein